MTRLGAEDGFANGTITVSVGFELGTADSKAVGPVDGTTDGTVDGSLNGTVDGSLNGWHC